MALPDQLHGSQETCAEVTQLFDPGNPLDDSRLDIV